MDPIVIIGTGLAGYSVAREFRKQDSDTPLVMLTRDDGANYYKPDLSEAYTKDNEPEALVKKDAETMAEDLNADIRCHVEVDAIHPAENTVSVNGEPLVYSQLVLARGAQPIEIPLSGDAAQAIYQVNNLRDYTALRKALKDDVQRIGILGAGLIGCEFANDLSEAGFKVHVVDPIEWPLKRFLPEACGHALQKALADLGVDWHLGCAAEGVSEAGNGLHLALTDGETLNVDLVLSAIGLRPGIELAEQAGLKVDEGIVVDRELRTSGSNIFALGDCAEVEGQVLPFVMPLMNAARAIAKSLAGEATQVKYPVMPVIVKTPACPVIVYPPQDSGGEWKVSGDAPDLEARYEDENGRLLGFALCGEAVSKRRDYLKEAPPVLPAT